MKTILPESKLVLIFLLVTAIAKAQYTCQSPLRTNGFSFSTINKDSTAVLEQGIQTGCAIVNSQPVWFLFGQCVPANFSFQFNGHKSNSSFNDTTSVVLYGPFSDTLNLSAKLINSNIAFCDNQISPMNPSLSSGSIQYNRTEIYIVLIMSTPGITSVGMNISCQPYMESDPKFCPFCDGKLSEMYQPLCTVTFDSASQKNKLVWPKDIFTPAQDYVIFRENANSTFDTVAYQSIALVSEMVDATSDPLSKSHKYKMGIRDSCGQIVDKNNINAYATPTFTTIHLIAYPIGVNSAGLIWNAGTAGAPFLIYRTNQSGVTTLIDSVALMGGGNQTYTDVNAPAGLNSYQIAVRVNPPCVPTLLPSYDLVQSNPAGVIVTGINELTNLSSAISVQPNPFNDFTKIDLHLLSNQNSKVVLRNVTGQIVLQFDDVKTNELIINKNNLAQGLYFLEVTGDHFYARKKVVVQ